MQDLHLRDQIMSAELVGAARDVLNVMFFTDILEEGDECACGKPFPLQVAVKKNIVATNLFYNEFTRLVQSAKQAPGSPIVLEAHGPFSYEGVFSLSIYLTSLGITNPVSVRYHSDSATYGNYLDQLQAQLLSLQNTGSDRFKPFTESQVKPASGCMSVGIYGAPDKTCAPFTIRISE